MVDSPPERAGCVPPATASEDTRPASRRENRPRRRAAAAKYLRFPWWLARVGLVVPRVVRDAVYRLVARNRYRWFGRTEACRLPTPDLRARFLD